MLRLSPHVYQGHTMAAVGIAAHEAGHALQDAKRYAPLVVRNAVVPVASFGGGISMILLMIGFMMSACRRWCSLASSLYSAVVFFQLVNLPVEFDASNRAKAQLDALGIVPRKQQQYVRDVLNAAAWTYVAGTLQAVMTLLYSSCVSAAAAATSEAQVHGDRGRVELKSTPLAVYDDLDDLNA